MMKNLFLACTVLLFNALGSFAQDSLVNPLDTLNKSVRTLEDELTKIKRLKITGYMQPQWQYIDSAGAPSFAGGDFVSATGNPYYSRFMMRRGRIKFTYELKNATFVLQPDITEKGVFMRETYIKLTDPWINWFSLIAGCSQVPFGWEVVYSSSLRETPERARYNQILFPTERDLGVFASIAPPKTSSLSGLKLDLAVMNGSAGVSQEFDNHKDFVGRIQYGKTSKNEKFTYSIGSSYYHGGYKTGNVKDYNFTTLASGDKGFEFAADTANYNRVAKREYMGADFQVSLDWAPGITTIRGEYIKGEQPGTSSGSKSPAAMPTSALYHREFDGALVYFIQNIGQSRFQLVLKYDWYDPNVNIKGNEIGVKSTNTKLGDVRFDTYGFGLNVRLHPNVKLVMYYDLVKNESTLIPGYTKDIEDNVTTVRMQYRF